MEVQSDRRRRHSTQNRRQLLSQIDINSEWRAIYEEELALHQDTQVKLEKALRDKAQMQKQYEELQKKLLEMQEKVREQNDVIFRLGGKHVNRQTSRRMLPLETPAFSASFSSQEDKGLRITDNEKALLLRIDALEQENQGLLKRNKSNNKLLLEMYRKQTQATLQIPDEDHYIDKKAHKNHLKPPMNRYLSANSSIDSVSSMDSEMDAFNSLSPAQSKAGRTQRSNSNLFRIKSATQWDERRMSALKDDLEKQMAEIMAENPEIAVVATATPKYSRPGSSDEEKERSSPHDMSHMSAMEEECPKEDCQMLRLKYEELEGNYVKMKSDYALVVDKLATLQFNHQRMSKHLNSKSFEG